MENYLVEKELSPEAVRSEEKKPSKINEEIENSLPPDRDLEKIIKEKIWALYPWLSSRLNQLTSSLNSQELSERPQLSPETQEIRQLIEASKENSEPPPKPPRRNIINIIIKRFSRKTGMTQPENKGEISIKRVWEKIKNSTRSLQESLRVTTIKLSLEYSEDKPLNTPPSTLEEATENLLSIKRKLQEINTLLQETPPGDKQKEIEEELASIENHLRNAINQLFECIERIRNKIIEEISITIEELNRWANYHPDFGDINLNLGRLAPFLRVPNKEQLEELRRFTDAVKNFIEEYSKTTPDDSNKKRVLEKVQGTQGTPRETITQIARRVEVYCRRCQEIPRSVSCHMTTERNAEEIIKEGYIISSAAQQAKNGVLNVNSPAGRRALLPEVTFSINGAETQYGPVGFVFPYPKAVGNYPFFEQLSSQGQGPFHYNELHICPPSPATPVEIPIDNCWLIVPQNKKQEWEENLSERFRGKIVPYYNHPSEAVKKILEELEKNTRNAPQNGILLPVPPNSGVNYQGVIRGADQPTPLFRWIELS